jgi:hypothetical protein
MLTNCTPPISYVACNSYMLGTIGGSKSNGMAVDG